jgi:hypothetical protein
MRLLLKPSDHPKLSYKYYTSIVSQVDVSTVYWSLIKGPLGLTSILDWKK